MDLVSQLWCRLWSRQTWAGILGSLILVPAGSDRDTLSHEDVPRKRQQRIAVMFWAGVGLAPIAALLLLVGQGVGPLRAAAVLAILAVVLIGLSVTFRADPATIRRELEEEFRREVDHVRAEVATLRRGVQLTVNRELDRVRGEIEAASATTQTMRTQATRLPAQPTQPLPAVTGPTNYQNYQAAHHNWHSGAYAHIYSHDYSEVSPSSHQREFDTGAFYPDVRTVEPIREQTMPPPAVSHTQGGPHRRDYGPVDPISGDVLAPMRRQDDSFELPSLDHLPEPDTSSHRRGRHSTSRW